MKSPSPQPHQKPLLHAKKRSQVAPRTGLRGVFFLGLLALLSLVALLPGKSGAAASLSPTGRTPKLLWTPQRQAVWNRMR
ncbi:MAG TPA: hypothetical protein VK689_08585, partial [Armatimonadota bacterium]|nr:hypothetical protein [Armatimonadota bacterium]